MLELPRRREHLHRPLFWTGITFLFLGTVPMVVSLASETLVRARDEVAAQLCAGVKMPGGAGHLPVTLNPVSTRSGQGHLGPGGSWRQRDRLGGIDSSGAT